MVKKRVEIEKSTSLLLDLVKAKWTQPGTIWSIPTRLLHRSDLLSTGNSLPALVDEMVSLSRYKIE